MVATLECRENGRTDLRPLLEHLLVAEAKHAAAMNRELRIAPTVGFESLFSAVEGAAVDLDDEALADQEIDVPDTGESDLLARPNSESTKSK